MSACFEIFRAVFFVLFVGASWLGPRNCGLSGAIGAQLFVLFGLFIIEGVAIGAGRYEYDGLMSILGLLTQAFLLNCLLLPVAILAIWRRTRAHCGTS